MKGAPKGAQAKYSLTVAINRVIDYQNCFFASYTLMKVSCNDMSCLLWLYMARPLEGGLLSGWQTPLFARYTRPLGIARERAATSRLLLL